MASLQVLQAKVVTEHSAKLELRSAMAAVFYEEYAVVRVQQLWRARRALRRGRFGLHRQLSLRRLLDVTKGRADGKPALSTRRARVSEKTLVDMTAEILATAGAAAQPPASAPAPSAAAAAAVAAAQALAGGRQAKKR